MLPRTCCFSCTSAPDLSILSCRPDVTFRGCRLGVENQSSIYLSLLPCACPSAAGELDKLFADLKKEEWIQAVCVCGSELWLQLGSFRVCESFGKVPLKH